MRLHSYRKLSRGYHGMTIIGWLSLDDYHCHAWSTENVCLCKERVPVSICVTGKRKDILPVQRRKRCPQWDSGYTRTKNYPGAIIAWLSSDDYHCHALRSLQILLWRDQTCDFLPVPAATTFPCSTIMILLVWYSDWVACFLWMVVINKSKRLRNWCSLCHGTSATQNTLNLLWLHWEQIVISHEVTQANYACDKTLMPFRMAANTVY